MSTIRPAVLLTWMNAVLVKQGMYAADAEIASRRLIESELLACPRGGIRWFSRLVSAMELGDIDPRAQIVTSVDLPALAVLDGSTGIGQVALTRGLQLGVEKAKAVGSATIVIKNSRPVGDPTACLSTATSAGCLAAILTACKSQTEPFFNGPSSTWGWPTATGFSAVATEHDPAAGIWPTAFGGTKLPSTKKKLFRDDAEHLCLVIDPARCRPIAEFQTVIEQADGNRITSPEWLSDPERWPAERELSADVMDELREVAASARIALNE